MKKKLAFVDHNFHKKSRSGDFLRDIFKKNYKINNFWWSLKDQYNLYKKIKNYENIFFFQSLLPLEDMIKLRDKNLMWAPMYDSPHHPIGFSPLLWKIINHYNIKVLSFSKSLTKQMIETKVNFIELKYYKKSNFKKKKTKKKN